MDFLDISSLRAAYQYAFKIEQKLKNETWKFCPRNPSHQKQLKSNPNPQNKGNRKDLEPQDNQSRLRAKGDTGKTEKDIEKWYDFYKVPWHKTVECRLMKSLVAEVNSSQSDVVFDFESKLERGRWIIDVELSATVATTKVQRGEPNKPKKGEHLFQSHMWVKGTPLHPALLTKPQPKPYTIRKLRQESDLLFSEQCGLSYDIKPFKYEVMCDVSPL